MIDGVAQSSAGEAFDFSKIPASQISRIEIIEGSSSHWAALRLSAASLILSQKSRSFRALPSWKRASALSGCIADAIMLVITSRGLQIELEYSHFDTDNNFTYHPTWAPDELMKRENNRKVQDAYLIKAVYNLKKSGDTGISESQYRP